MRLAAGSHLGPFEIRGPLGAGGMGEVYRAKDSRLQRDVAIKILASEAVTNAEKYRRFQLEALAASALNHPNILVVHDIGIENGIHYIVSEFVDGVSMRKLLQSGPVQIKQLLMLATQIAEGLAVAHQAGIIHRDLKPENIMVTHDGRVKILDFGLAKLSLPKLGGEEAETIPPSLTETGIIQGTVPYMSPEQAAGKSVDFHSDQYSFGLVLYEMATGKRAFSRKSVPETLSAIINEEASPISSLNPKIPAPISWLTERCMAKDPRQRYESTTDLFRDLRDLRDHLPLTTSVEGMAPVSKHEKSRLHFLPVTIALILAAALAYLAGKRLSSVGVEQATMRPIPSFQRLTFQRGQIGGARFSLDGQSIIYSASWNGNPEELFSTRPGSSEGRPLGISPPAEILAISHSGQMAILMGTNGTTLAVAPLGGGAPRELVENVGWADWAPDGKELAIIHRTEGKRELEFPIGKSLYKTTGWIGDLRIKGMQIAFIDHPSPAAAAGSICIVDSKGNKKQLSRQWPGVRGLAWSSAGEEIWFTAREGTTQYALYAVNLAGQERVVQTAPGDLMLWDTATDGRVLLSLENYSVDTFVLLPDETKERDLTWLDNTAAVDLSADAKVLLLNRYGAGAGTSDITYLRYTDGSAAIPLGEGSAVALSPDGKWALASTGTSQQQLVLLPTRAGDRKLMPSYGIEKYFQACWFQDGKRILFSGHETGDQQNHLYVQDLLTGKQHLLTSTPVDLGKIAVSPDGEWAAAISKGKVTIFPVKGGKARAVSDGEPIRWSVDGRSLFVWIEPNIYRVDVSNGHKELWKEIKPSVKAGISTMFSPLLSADGRSYLYSYARILSDLYVVDDLK